MSTVREVANKPRGARKPFRIPLHMLVGATGEPSSAGALRVAAALAKRSRANVHVLTVTTPFPHAITMSDVTSPPMLDEENRRAALAGVRAQLESVPDTARWMARAVIGWPSEAIVDEAEQWPASLIVLGRGEHHAWDRLFGPETAIAVARRSRAPVLAVARTAADIPGRVLAAVDFTESSVNAAKLAARLMARDGTLILAHVSAFADTHALRGSLPDLYETGVEDRLAELQSEIHQTTGRRVELALLSGDVVARLLEYAEQENCDLIAVGGHRQGFVDRILIGSVRSGVLRAAKCSVLIGPQQAVT
jgi:nucleotide-binding universal stress UspA family protein